MVSLIWQKLYKIVFFFLIECNSYCCVIAAFVQSLDAVIFFSSNSQIPIIGKDLKK